MTRLILIRNAPSEDVALSARMDHRQAVVVAPVRLEEVLEAVVPAHRVVVVHHRRVAVRRAVRVRLAAVVNRVVRVRPVVAAVNRAVRVRPVAEAVNRVVRVRPVAAAVNRVVRARPVAAAVNRVVRARPVAAAVNRAVRVRPVAAVVNRAVRVRPVVVVNQAVRARPVAAVVNRAVRVRRVVRALHQVAASPAAPVRRQAAVVLLPQVILLRMTMTVSHAIVMMRIVKMVMAIRGRLSPLKTVMSRIIAKVPARLAGLPTHPILLLSGRDAVLNRMLLPFLSVLTVRWNGRRVLMPFPVR